jgi:transketolase
MTANYKKEILSILIPYFEKDEKFFLLLCDTGFGVIDEFKNRFPDRIINAGIAEQSTIGIASGMALSGMKPVVYGMCNFLVYRALEQIRNDIVLQNANVKLIGVGANNYFDFLGKSHTCGEQDEEIMNLIGVEVYDPQPHKDFSILVDIFMKSEKPGYLRV